MIGIFQKMDDFHTSWDVPKPFADSIALVGFLIRDFFEPGGIVESGKPRRRYVVSEVASEVDFGDNTFGVGSEILLWDGQDIDDVARSLGKESYGSNEAAQMIRAINLLAFRLLLLDPLPMKLSVEIQFRDSAGVVDTINVPWIYIRAKDDLISMRMARQYTPFRWFGKQNRGPGSSRMRNPFGLRQSGENGIPSLIGPVRVPEGNRTTLTVAEEFQDLFSAEVLQTNVGPIGRFIVPSFASEVTTQLITEISRILRQMPSNGLIMDLRNNAGGSSDYAKALSELVTGKQTDDQPTSVRVSNFTRMAIFSKDEDIPPEAKGIFELFAIPYQASITTATKVGEAFTGPGPSVFNTTVRDMQERMYFGPVVTVVDGNTYSAGDIYTTIQLDKNASLVVGTSDNTGAGGASTLPFSSLVKLFPKLLKPLPGGANFTCAWNRWYRTAGSAGAIIENFGFELDLRYNPTLNDAVNGDCDLFEFLAKKLVSMETTELAETMEPVPSPEDSEFLA